MELKCLACISEWIGSGSDADQYDAVVNDAVTMAPAWESKTMMGQMMMAAVPLPSCLKHLGVKEKSPQEKAMQSGLFLGGQSPQ
jgi:hypothetical protein